MREPQIACRDVPFRKRQGVPKTSQAWPRLSGGVEELSGQVREHQISICVHEKTPESSIYVPKGLEGATERFGVHLFPSEPGPFAVPIDVAARVSLQRHDSVAVRKNQHGSVLRLALETDELIESECDPYETG